MRAPLPPPGRACVCQALLVLVVVRPGGGPKEGGAAVCMRVRVYVYVRVARGWGPVLARPRSGRMCVQLYVPRSLQLSRAGLRRSARAYMYWRWRVMCMCAQCVYLNRCAYATRRVLEQCQRMACMYAAARALRREHLCETLSSACRNVCACCCSYAAWRMRVGLPRRTICMRCDAARKQSVRTHISISLPPAHRNHRVRHHALRARRGHAARRLVHDWRQGLAGGAQVRLRET